MAHSWNLTVWILLETDPFKRPNSHYSGNKPTLPTFIQESVVNALWYIQLRTPWALNREIKQLEKQWHLCNITLTIIIYFIFFTVWQYIYTQTQKDLHYITLLLWISTCLVLFWMTVAVPYLTCLTVISLFVCFNWKGLWPKACEDWAHCRAT